MTTKLLVSLLALAIGCLGASTGWAQAGAHIMVSPADLKWADVPSLPPGAKIAVIEGPPTEAVPPKARTERQRIIDALAQCGGNQTRAARLLGCSRRTLTNKLNEYQVPRPRKQRRPLE